LYQEILNELEKLSSDEFQVETIGYSVLDRPIKKIRVGKGKTKILIWSQMHGNESTSTKAIFDLLQMIQLKQEVVKTVTEKVTLHIIPVLNPDGMLAYTRENANGVDLNRDALTCLEPESKLLRSTIEDIQPDFCFNMHGQRTIFSAGLHPEPATLSFLSPSVNEERSITSVRKKVMQLVVDINRTLQEFIPGKVGRYDDGFNLNCTGDYFQSKGVPVILFESGHYPEDYNREQVRMYTFLALYKGLSSIAENTLETINYKDYFQIPQNQKLYYDVIIRNISVKGKSYEVAIQFKESLKDGELVFIPLLAQVNGLASFWGHKEIDAKGKSALMNGVLLTRVPAVNTEFDVENLEWV
jgi:hypothetical protein